MALTVVKTESAEFGWKDLTTMRELAPPEKMETLRDYLWRCKSLGLISIREVMEIEDLNPKVIDKPYLL